MKGRALMFNQMNPIEKPTYRRIRRRTISFRKLDLQIFNEEQIRKFINVSFSLPVGLFPQVPGGKPIFRACINQDSKGNNIQDPFTSKARISFHPSPPKYGRCNLVGDPLFYGADGMEIAVLEVCHNKLKNDFPLYLTIGLWSINKKLQVSVICNSNRAKKRSGDLVKAYHSISKMKKSQVENMSEYRVWKRKTRFFSEEFAKAVKDGQERNYLFSAIFSNTILNKEVNGYITSGIWYPSVAYEYYGHNVAYNTDLIKNNILCIDKVLYVKCSYRSKRKLPKIEILKETTKISGDVINWN